MKVTLTNNSCNRISRLYSNFELDLPGHVKQELEVPDAHVENLKKYLRVHHPAVIFTPETQEAVAPPLQELTSASSALASTVAVVSDLPAEEGTGITVEQYLRDKGLLSDTPLEVPAEVAAPSPVEAPATQPSPVKGKKTSNLIPAKSKAAKAEKAAKTTGGNK